MDSKLVFLIVDDDGQVREILEGYLRSFGFDKVVQARDGRAALKIIQSHTQHIDFIISDWEMPHVDGLTLLRAVRKDPARDGVKFIMVTSQGSRERMKITKAAKSHVDAYVVKPFRAHILQEKINNLLAGLVDKSVAEFEPGIMPEVPHNETLQEGKKKKRKSNGSVILDKESKGAGFLVNIGKEVNPGPIGAERPPQTYDLSRMSVELILKLAQSYLRVRWFEKAIKLCTETNQIFPNNVDVLVQLAQCYFAKGEFEPASLYLKDAIKIQPYHVEAQTLIAEIAIKKIA